MNAQKTDWFKIGYWAAAAIQMVGTLVFFFEIGGANFRGALYAISGAACLELMILALNSYGEARVGFFRTALMLTSLFLITVSGAIQVADIFVENTDTEMAGKLLWAYAPAKIIVAAIPSFAMAVVTVIRFAGDAGDVSREIKRLTDQITDWNTWQVDQDAKIAAKDTEIAELSAKLDEARNRPMLQQVVSSGDTLRIHSEVSLPKLPEPATMPDTLLIDDENTLITQYIGEGLNKGQIIKRLMIGYGYEKRGAENQPDYDRLYKRLNPKVERWLNKQHLPSTNPSIESGHAAR